MTAMIDTLKFAKTFETAGFAKLQAEALTSAFVELNAAGRDDLVTKDDLRVAVADLRREIVVAQSKTLWALFGSQGFVLAAVVALSRFAHLFA